MPSTTPKQSNKPAQQKRPSTFRITCLILILVGLLLCCGTSFLAVNLLPNLLATTFVSGGSLPSGSGTPSSGSTPLPGASDVATAFMQALQSHSYNKAYNLLDASLGATLASTDFTQQAQQVDQCAGLVADFHLSFSTVKGETAQYIYQVTRKKLSHAYAFTLQLRSQEGVWTITSYGSNDSLNPSNAPSC